MADDPLLTRLREVRARTLALGAGLSDADATAQSMPDASPAKWHLAHTSWFFETFVLGPHAPGYARFDPAFDLLFNSYYESLGPRTPRAERGLITRPSLERVRAYRGHVDAGLEAAWAGLPGEARALVGLGLAHEEQHQELLLTDVLHLFSRNPTDPAVFESAVPPPPCVEGRGGGAWPGAADTLAGNCTPTQPSPQGGGLAKWTDHPGGIVRIGHDGPGFAFDAEGPAHEVLLRPYALGDRLVTNAEWDAFVADGGYTKPLLWLSDGWAWVKREGIAAPLHWRADGAEFTLYGRRARDAAAPVAHISFYEADAFATWAGARLPTEAEWEAAAAGADPNARRADAPIAPTAAPSGDGPRQMFGEVWQWTNSAFLPHPGFRAAAGAVGEYNGKFMSGQMVLKGSSCATPPGHARASYRNFFPPHARWQMTGLRLARA